MKRWMWWAGGGLAVLFVVIATVWFATGQSPEPTLASATPGVTTSPVPPANGGTYESAEAINAALKRAGVVCNDYKAETELDRADGIDGAQCHAFDADAVIRIYSDAEPGKPLRLTEDWVEIHGRAGDYSKAGVVGVNWTVWGQHHFIDQVHDTLGGKLVEPA